MGNSYTMCLGFVALFFTVFSLGIVSAASSQESVKVVGSVYLPAKVRDFREAHKGKAGWGEQIPIPGGHPDFCPTASGTGPQRGAIEPWICTLGSRSTFDGDHRNPKLIIPRTTHGYTGEKEFNDWYNDRDSSINRSFLIYLKFDVREDCILSYDSDAFFPIDDGKAFSSLDVPPLNTFGHLQPDFPQHNYGFTLEFHTSFTYVKDGGQRFRFSGDDDVWVFVNDSLVIDLGGTHSEQSAEIFLDDFPPDFLRDGKKHSFDLFFAERMPTSSRLRIETSILFDLGFKDLVAVKARRAADAIINCYGQYVIVPEDEPVFPTAVQSNSGLLRSEKPAVNATITGSALTVTVAGANASAATGIRMYATDGSVVRLARVRGRVENGRSVWTGTLPDVSLGAYALEVRSGTRRLNTKVIALR